jgi:hypothetical protein
MPRFGKAPLMALRERLAKAFEAAPSKQELVVPKNEIPPELYESLKRGDGRAMETVSRALNAPTPRGAEGLRQLVEQVSPSRRGFLKGVGTSAAHLIMPSPLKFLQATEDALRPRLTAELTPMELMEYSKKYFDKPVPLLMDQAEYLGIEAGDGTDRLTISPAIRQLLAHGDVDSEVQRYMLEAMDLKPTEQNRDSMDKLAGVLQEFSPGWIEANADDAKTAAQMYAGGEWDETDGLLGSFYEQLEPGKPLFTEGKEILPGMQGSTDLTPEYQKFTENLDKFIQEIYEGQTSIDTRRNLDGYIADHAYERGYMDPNYDEVYRSMDDQLANLGSINEGVSKTVSEWADDLKKLIKFDEMPRNDVDYINEFLNDLRVSDDNKALPWDDFFMRLRDEMDDAGLLPDEPEEAVVKEQRRIGAELADKYAPLTPEGMAKVKQNRIARQQELDDAIARDDAVMTHIKSLQVQDTKKRDPIGWIKYLEDNKLINGDQADAMLGFTASEDKMNWVDFLSHIDD